MHKVNMQIVTMPVPAQEGITRDNVTVKVDAVVYWRVYHPPPPGVDVQDYKAAHRQGAQGAPPSGIGESEPDDPPSQPERPNPGAAVMMENAPPDLGGPN